MSWSVSAVGKPPAVAASVARQLSSSHCVDPEEGVKQAAGSAIAAALAAQDPQSAVQVTASGHQHQNYDATAKPTTISNTLSISIQPLYGFVE